jgi:hypothetical protein
VTLELAEYEDLADILAELEEAFGSTPDEAYKSLQKHNIPDAIADQAVLKHYQKDTNRHLWGDYFSDCS